MKKMAAEAGFDHVLKKKEVLKLTSLSTSSIVISSLGSGSVLLCYYITQHATASL